VDKEFEVVVAGGGIAGLTAGLTAARLGRRTLVLTGDVLGGQLLSIEKIDGFPGYPEGIPGYDLCPMAQEQATAAGAQVAAGEVIRLDSHGGRWRLVTSEGDTHAGAVIIATGCTLKELGTPGEARLRGRGVSHCATCDAPLLRGRTVAVIGGGDSALQESLTLAPFAARVFILERGSALSGQAIYRERVRENPKIEVRLNTVVDEILGDDKVSGLRTRELSSGAAADLEVGGVFVYVGLQPSTPWLAGQLTFDADGRIPTDGWMRTELKGVLAAGTVRAGSPCRAVSSAGDGATAALAADRFLTDGAWHHRQTTTASTPALA